MRWQSNVLVLVWMSVWMSDWMVVHGQEVRTTTSEQERMAQERARVLGVPVPGHSSAPAVMRWLEQGRRDPLRFLRLSGISGSGTRSSSSSSSASVSAQQVVERKRALLLAWHPDKLGKESPAVSSGLASLVSAAINEAVDNALCCITTNNNQNNEDIDMEAMAEVDRHAGSFLRTVWHGACDLAKQCASSVRSAAAAFIVDPVDWIADVIAGGYARYIGLLALPIPHSQRSILQNIFASADTSNLKKIYPRLARVLTRSIAQPTTHERIATAQQHALPFITHLRSRLEAYVSARKDKRTLASFRSRVKLEARQLNAPLFGNRMLSLLSAMFRQWSIIRRSFLLRPYHKFMYRLKSWTRNLNEWRHNAFFHYKPVKSLFTFFTKSFDDATLKLINDWMYHVWLYVRYDIAYMVEYALKEVLFDRSLSWSKQRLYAKGMAEIAAIYGREAKRPQDISDELYLKMKAKEYDVTGLL